MRRTRAKYTRTIFNETTLALAAIEEAEISHARQSKNLVSYREPDDVALHNKLQRRKKRNERLDLLVPDRVCPTCGHKKLAPSAWIDSLMSIEHKKINCLRAIHKGNSDVDKRKKAIRLAAVVAEFVHHPIVCRSCWAGARAAVMNGVTDMEINLDEIGEEIVIKRYKINGMVLASCRLALGLTAQEFSNLAGWNRTYTSHIENTIPTVNEETYQTILQVLREAIAKRASSP